MSFSGSEISAAVADGVAAETSGDATAADDALEDELVAAAQGQGEYLADDDITVAHLESGELRVDVALPEDIDFESLTVSADPESGRVTVDSTAVADASPENFATGGPGLGTWSAQDEGQYVLKVYDRDGFYVGNGLFLWRRYKLLDDGNGSVDWYAYTRRGFGQPENIPYRDDYQIQLLRIGNYPWSQLNSEAEGLLNWTDMNPPEDVWECNSGTPFDTSIQLNTGKVFGFGFTPHECAEYDIWYNPDIPGQFILTYDQGLWVNEGNRSVAYTVVWRSRQGTAGYQHDQQRIEFQRTPDQMGGELECASTDLDKTCRY